MNDKFLTGLYLPFGEEEDSDRMREFLERKEEAAAGEILITKVYREKKKDERLSFEAFMEDVRHGEINCVLVKQMAAFSPDPLETGYYLETVFPLLNVRFLSMEEDFDSKSAQDMEKLKQWLEKLVKECASRELSRRQGLFRRLCRESGRVMGYNRAYGYVFDRESERLKLDPKTETYVRVLFAWALDGVKRKEIAARLAFLEAPTPGECAGEKGEISWSSSLLQKILYNPIYAGFHVMGRRKVSLYQGIAQHETEPEEWVYFPEFHEAYLTMEDYEHLQELRSRNKDIRKKSKAEAPSKREKVPDYFPEKVFCGGCNRKMRFLRGNRQGEPSFGYYRCSTPGGESRCKNRHLPDKLLELVVMERYQELVEELYKAQPEEREILLRLPFSQVAERLVEEIRVWDNGERVEVRFYKEKLNAFGKGETRH